VGSRFTDKLKALDLMMEHLKAYEKKGYCLKIKLKRRRL